MNTIFVTVFGILLGVVAATASENPLEWEFRLAGGLTALSGRVEMRPNNTAPWGTICKDIFKENNFGAIAACNSAGLVGVTQAVYKPTFGPGTGPIYLTNVDCNENTTFIQNCSRSPLLLTGACVHYEDVGVECSPPIHLWKFKMVNGTAPSNGIVIFKPMPSLPWGTVYYFSFWYNSYLLNRQIMCRTMGYNTSKATATDPRLLGAVNDMTSYPPYLYLNYCSDAAISHIGYCSYLQFGSQSWTGWNGLALDCDPPPPKLIGPVTVKLVNGATASSGIIWISTNASNASVPWLGITGEDVTNNQHGTPMLNQFLTPAQKSILKAVCTAAGFPNATNPIFGKYGANMGPPADALGYARLIGMDFNCSDSPGTSLSDCTVGPELGTGYSRNTYYYAGVDCLPEPLNFTTWEYRLVGGNNATIGRVELRPNNTAPWLGVCANNEFGTRGVLWTAMCRTMGFNTNYGMRSRAPIPGLTSTIYYLGFSEYSYCPTVSNNGVTILPNTSLKDCKLSPIGMHSCGTGNDLLLDCGFPDTAEMRLVASTKVGAGRLEMRPNAAYEWGTVSDVWNANMAYNWEVYNAYAICWSLGFLNVTNPTLTMAYGPGNTTQIVWWSLVMCQATDTIFHLCNSNFPFGFSYDYGHYYDVGVDCFPPPFEPIVTLVDGGDPWKGRIMLQYTPYIPTGSVCNDMFKFNHFAWNAACRSAGFVNVTNARYRSFGPAPASAPISVDDYVCTPTDRFLQNCTHRPYGQHNCHHGEDAGVDCNPPPEDTSVWQFRLADGTAPTNGRLEMRPGSTYGWGSVCAGPYFNHSLAAWEAACRQVGILNPPRARWRYFPKGSDTVYLDNVSCNTGDLFLVPNCTMFPLGSYRCSPSEIAGLDCNATAEVPSQWQFRLTDGRSNTSGRVEMRPDSATPWGAVCRHGLTSFEALRTVCRTGGHPTSTRPFVYRPLTPPPSTLLFYLDSAVCNASTKYLHNCSYAPLYSHDCSIELGDALYVECFPTATVVQTPSSSSSASPRHTKSELITPTGGALGPARTVTTTTTLTRSHFGTASPRLETHSRTQILTASHSRPQTSSRTAATKPTRSRIATATLQQLPTATRSSVLTSSRSSLLSDSVTAATKPTRSHAATRSRTQPPTNTRTAATNPTRTHRDTVSHQPLDTRSRTIALTSSRSHFESDSRTAATKPTISQALTVTQKRHETSTRSSALSLTRSSLLSDSVTAATKATRSHGETVSNAQLETLTRTQILTSSRSRLLTGSRTAATKPTRSQVPTVTLERPETHSRTLALTLSRSNFQSDSATAAPAPTVSRIDTPSVQQPATLSRTLVLTSSRSRRPSESHTAASSPTRSNVDTATLQLRETLSGSHALTSSRTPLQTESLSAVTKATRSHVATRSRTQPPTNTRTAATKPTRTHRDTVSHQPLDTRSRTIALTSSRSHFESDSRTAATKPTISQALTATLQQPETSTRSLAPTSSRSQLPSDSITAATKATRSQVPTVTLERPETHSRTLVLTSSRSHFQSDSATAAPAPTVSRIDTPTVQRPATLSRTLVLTSSQSRRQSDSLTAATTPTRSRIATITFQQPETITRTHISTLSRSRLLSDSATAATKPTRSGILTTTLQQPGTTTRTLAVTSSRTRIQSNSKSAVTKPTSSHIVTTTFKVPPTPSRTHIMTLSRSPVQSETLTAATKPTYSSRDTASLEQPPTLTRTQILTASRSRPQTSSRTAATKPTRSHIATTTLQQLPTATRSSVLTSSRSGLLSDSVTAASKPTRSHVATTSLQKPRSMSSSLNVTTTRSNDLPSVSETGPRPSATLSTKKTRTMMTPLPSLSVSATRLRPPSASASPTRIDSFSVSQAPTATGPATSDSMPPSVSASLPPCDADRSALDSISGTPLLRPLGTAYLAWPPTNASTASTPALNATIGMPFSVPLSEAAAMGRNFLPVLDPSTDFTTTARLVDPATLQPFVRFSAAASNATNAAPFDVSSVISVAVRRLVGTPMHLNGTLSITDAAAAAALFAPGTVLLVAVPTADLLRCVDASRMANMTIVARVVLVDVTLFSGGAAGDRPLPPPPVREAELPVVYQSGAAAEQVARMFLACDGGASSITSMAFFRMLSPFATGPAHAMVLVGSAVVTGIVLGAQGLTVLWMRARGKANSVLACAAAARAPAITIAVAEPLWFGAAYAGASLVVGAAKNPLQIIAGATACAVTFAIPVVVVLGLRRYASRRIIAYKRVFPQPVPACLAPHLVPTTRVKPEVLVKVLAPLVSFRSLHPLIPAFSSLSPVITALVVLVTGLLPGLCRLSHALIAVAHILLAVAIMAVRPRRTTLLNAFAATHHLSIAAVFRWAALILALPTISAERAEAVLYTFIVIQTGFVGCRIALTPLAFFSDRLLPYKGVRAIAEYISPAAEDKDPLEFMPGHPDFKRDDEDRRLYNVDDDPILSSGSEGDGDPEEEKMGGFLAFVPFFLRMRKAQREKKRVAEATAAALDADDNDEMIDLSVIPDESLSDSKPVKVQLKRRHSSIPMATNHFRESAVSLSSEHEDVDVEDGERFQPRNHSSHTCSSHENATFSSSSYSPAFSSSDQLNESRSSSSRATVEAVRTPLDSEAEAEDDLLW